MGDAKTQKVLGFKIEIDGASTEAQTLALLDQQLKALKRSRDDLNKQVKDGFTSPEQIQAMEDYNREIKKLQEETKNLNKIVDSAPDSLSRMRAELIRAKDAASNCSTEIRERMTPYIKQMSDEIEKTEKAMGTGTRGVGKYADGIKDVASNILGFTTISGAVILILSKMKDAFASTEGGLRTMTETTSIFKQFWYEMVEGVNKWSIKGLFKDLILSSSDATKLDDFRKKQRDWNIEIANQEEGIKEIRLQAAKLTQDSAAQVEKLTMAEDLETGIIQEKSKHLKEYMGILSDEIKLRPQDTTLLDEYNQKQIEYIKLQGDMSLRIASKLATAEEKKDKADLIVLTKAQYEATTKMMAIEKQEADLRMKTAIAGLKNGGALNPFQPNIVSDAAKKVTDKVKETVADIGNIIDKDNAHQMELTKRFEDAKLKIVEEHAESKLRVMSGAGSLLEALSIKNKAIQKAELVAEKGLAIAEIIIQTQVANAQIRAKAAASTLPGPGYLLRVGANELMATPLTVANNIAAGLNIAAVVAATVTGLLGYARGGKIRSGFHVNTGTKDDTLIMANRSETVLTANHVAMLGGSRTMANIGVPGYANGGYIGQSAPSVPSFGFDMKELARIFESIKIPVNIDINKINQAQRSVQIVNESQRI